MVEQLLNHIHRHDLCKTTDKILLAVSGGIDSMVMLDLFRTAGFTIGVAHCNFQLRGKEAEKDEAFVRANSADLPFHSKRFDTKAYAQAHGISTQMAARELRYQFFDELLNSYGYHVIATAHHLNDSIETVLLNLVRGSGVEGLTGIPVKHGRIIRPLLFATRSMIRLYADEAKVQWREDASNESEEYQRNFIRLQVIPRLKEINPNFEATFRNTVERLEGARQLTDLFIRHFQQSAVECTNGMFSIDKNELKKTNAPALLLWELIKMLDFNFDQCKAIVEDHQSGKIFLSSTHQLVVDRARYIVQPLALRKSGPVIISGNDSRVKGHYGELLFTEYRNTDPVRKDNAVAQLDAAKVCYPLTWRVWQAGDIIIPLGMNQHKKISDLLVDSKVPLTQKEKITVLESEGKIIWVVGIRINDEYKITGRTDRVLCIEYRPE